MTKDGQRRSEFIAACVVLAAVAVAVVIVMMS
jgi:hypothetical protein